MEEPAGVERNAWPVTQGVPFADGELEQGAPVRIVTAEGKPLPTQALCLTTWCEDLRFVKWLLVDFQIDLPAGQTRDVYLEYGPGVTPVSHEDSIRVESSGECSRIDTGIMQVEFSHNNPDFLAACQINTPDGWRDMLQGSPGAYLYMTDQYGNSCDVLRASPPTITIEDAGPLRASVCIKGYHASEDGQPFCPYVLRIHLYAGKTDMRFYHTFIFDQDPEKVELMELGVRFPLNLGEGLRMAFGGSETPHWSEWCKHARFLQFSDLEYLAHCDGEILGSGENTRGWGSLNSEGGSAVVVLRDMWQEYPKGIVMDEKGIDIQIWPNVGEENCTRLSRSGGCSHEETLKFSTPYKERAVYFNGTRDEAEFKRIVESNPTAPLNLKSLGASSREDLLWVEEMVAKYAPDRPASYNDTGTNNGFGAAKTTEFLLRFGAEAIPDESAENLGRCIQEPIIAPADVSYACATGAMRMFAPTDFEGFPEVEQGLEELFERIVVEPRNVLRTYGMIDYGDLMCSHSASPAAMWSHFKDDEDVIEKMKHCGRSYNNEANDQLYALWGYFIHTGQRNYFLAAEAYGEHMADVDITHLRPDGSKGGLIHYHNAHHWTGGASPSHTCMAGLVLQYYLTGNRRILDVCREVADWVLSHQEPCGIYSNKGALVREYTTPVANLLEFYQATWQPEYGDLARRSLKWLLLAMPEPGCFPVSIYTAGAQGDEAEVEQDGWHLRQAGGMTPQLLYDAVRVFGESDPIFKDALLGMAYRYVLGPEPAYYETLLVGPKPVKRQDPYFNAALIAYAYELTAAPVYAAYCQYYLREHFPLRAQQMSFTYVCWGSIIPPIMEAVRSAKVKYGEEKLAQIEKEWIQKVTEIASDKPEQPPVFDRPARRSLGVIKGYDV